MQREKEDWRLAVPDARELLAGRYRLGEQIAVGGTGQVWRGTDTVLGRAVAVKLLRPEYAGHAETLARFRAEARHAAQLAHPGIVQVYD
jgi:serine/threonine-protein kinase